MENGKWQMEKAEAEAEGEWKMEDGKWKNLSAHASMLRWELDCGRRGYWANLATVEVIS
jgi:hypothetical protein